MVPEKISGHLKGSRIRFAVRPHPRAVTAQELAAAVHVSGHRVAKSVLFEADGEPMMAVLPAADVIDVERLATALGVFAVRLMSEAEFTSLFNDSDIRRRAAVRIAVRRARWWWTSAWPSRAP